MDENKEFDNFQLCMKSFNINLASEFLSCTDFVTKNTGSIIQLLGEGLTKDNFRNKSDYFNFCEEQLVKIAQTKNGHDSIFDILELIDINDCILSSSVLAAVTALDGIENLGVVYLEYLLTNTFKSLSEMNETNLKDILMNILQHLIKLNKHFQNEQSVLFHFTKVAFLVLRANIDPTEYINVLAEIIKDPFCLLELEFDEMEEKTYLASFFYLYFKTGISWGPKIYNKYYILEKCSNLALSVFANDDFGKSFGKLILSKFEDNEIQLNFLNKCHEDFFMEAAKSCIFNEDVNRRKDSIDSMLIFINKLCSDAQYIIFKQIFSKPFDTCIKGQMMVTMKALISSKIRSNQDLRYFQGVRLLELIQLACKIPDESKCNVVENKEFILAAISFIHVMYSFSIADYYSHFSKYLNLGVEFHDFVNQFVVTVQNAIDFTNEKFKLEDKMLKSKAVKDNKIEEIDLGVPKLSDKEKKNILFQYSCATILVQKRLDLLKEILQRLNKQNKKL